MLEELPNCSTVGQEDAFEVGVERHLPAGFRAFVQGTIAVLATADAGDVVEDVDTAEVLDRGVEERFDLLFRGGVTSAKPEIALQFMRIFGS